MWIPLRKITLVKEKALQPIKREKYPSQPPRKPPGRAVQGAGETQRVASCVSALRATFLIATLEPTLERFA